MLNLLDLFKSHKNTRASVLSVEKKRSLCRHWQPVFFFVHKCVSLFYMYRILFRLRETQVEIPGFRNSARVQLM